MRTPTAITASNGRDEAEDDDGGGLLTSVVEDDRRSVALMPSLPEEFLAAWICEAAYILNPQKLKQDHF